MKRKKCHFFPHNFCKKTARFLNRVLKFCFLFSCFCFLFLNLHALIFPENERFEKGKKEVLNSPFNPQSHLNLAKVYLGIGNLEEAERELFLAENLASTKSQELISLEEMLKKKRERPRKIRQEISFWEKIIKEKPDYRDAYFQLAVLYYQIGQKGEVGKYLQKTLDLDPNFAPAKRLEKLIQK